ncbi:MULTISPECIES: hypothetical protein [Haloferax]|uniref:Uncharacterized protein n=1 Tax=Haloferax denitrificans ATCC 35960 TaxID=662478 RepID=M0JFP7_9EURY|nr:MULTISPECIES: hypothetical protein [Haloferax]EMA07937.1 hypothetical protein C438_02412 [Haloferax denitrificans ATCC 35960]MBC9988002.1 hypothetical protein [Haloferax sp. AS1]
MSDSHSPTDARSTDQRRPSRSILRHVAIGSVLFTIAAVQPVAAQDSVVCSAEKLPGMVEGFFQITTTLGFIGLAVIWQADSLAEIFTASPEQKKRLKVHKRAALKSALILAVLGPLYTVVASIMGLPLGDCVNLTPW